MIVKATTLKATTPLHNSTVVYQILFCMKDFMFWHLVSRLFHSMEINSEGHLKYHLEQRMCLLYAGKSLARVEYC